MGPSSKSVAAVTPTMASLQPVSVTATNAAASGTRKELSTSAAVQRTPPCSATGPGLASDTLLPPERERARYSGPSSAPALISTAGLFHDDRHRGDSLRRARHPTAPNY